MGAVIVAAVSQEQVAVAVVVATGTCLPTR